MPTAKPDLPYRRRSKPSSGSLRAAFARTWRRVFPARQSKHPFDQRHGVDTSGLIYADGLTSGHEHDTYSAGYYATAPSLFHEAILRWSWTLGGSGRRLNDYSFVDIGCGKGRVVMLAAGYPFLEIAGVELNQRLAAIAQRNLGRWMRLPLACRNLRIVRGDALSMSIPDGPVVLFFFNSFEREMVQMWIERLVSAASNRTEPIDLIYVHPEHAALFERTPGIKLLADEIFALSLADAKADVFGVNIDRCAIYRIGGSIDARKATEIASGFPIEYGADGPQV